MTRMWLLPIAALALVGAAATAQAAPAPVLGAARAATSQQAGTVEKVHDDWSWRRRYWRHHDHHPGWHRHRHHDHDWRYDRRHDNNWWQRRLDRRLYRSRSGY